ncbi:MAG: hypothetical protein Q8P51_07415 [Ignavibacteria bacterium]|nr:hypothetical protein [Ignavibacteria bacterium]
MNVHDLRNRLIASDFNILVGVIEDEHFDAKSGKYDLSTDSGALELAKDVSSFANRSGGLIVIGAKTTDDPTFYGRRVHSISPFAFNLVDPIDYHKVIKSWIYPRPSDIDIQWVPSNSDPSKGIVFIFVPKQPESSWPFLLRRDIDPNTNRRRREILYGYVEGVSHSSDPVSVESLHSMIKEGRDNQWKGNISNRLDAIEARLAQPSIVNTRRNDLDHLLPERIKKAVDAAGLNDHRTFSLVISPLDLVQVRSILSSTPDSIAACLENPPRLRSGGWGMDTGDRARIVSGELRRVKSNEYKVLDLYRDATLVFACRADETLLGWGNSFGNTRINPVALVEITYMFFDFYKLVIERVEPPTSDFCVRVQFQNLHNNGEITSLAPHGVAAQTRGFVTHRYLAPESSFATSFDIGSAGYDASTTTVLALREIYAWFGIEADKIPYLNGEQDAVDIEKIKDPRS